MTTIPPTTVRIRSRNDLPRIYGTNPLFRNKKLIFTSDIDLNVATTSSILSKALHGDLASIDIVLAYYNADAMVFNDIDMLITRFYTYDYLTNFKYNQYLELEDLRSGVNTKIDTVGDTRSLLTLPIYMMRSIEIRGEGTRKPYICDGVRFHSSDERCKSVQITRNTFIDDGNLIVPLLEFKHAKYCR
jgi:hypothetical protein